MNIEFISLQLNNFMSYESAFISFTDSGFTLLNGINKNISDNAESNGSGKSSLFDAIAWCLTGDTIRGTKDVKRFNSDTCSVELNLRVNTQTFKITRTKDPSNLSIIIDDKDMSGKGIRDSEKLLKNYLPDINAEVLNSVIIIGQGMPMRFTNNTPSGRKEVLEKLAKSDFMFDDIKNRLANRLTQVQDKKQELTIAIAKQEITIDSYNLSIENFNKQLSETNLDALKANLLQQEDIKKELTTDIATVEQQLSNMTKKYDDSSEQLKAMQENITQQLSLYAVEKQNKIAPIREQKSAINAQISALKSAIRQLKSVVDICPTCGQKLPNVYKIDTTDKENELELLKVQLSDIEKQEREVETFYTEDYNRLTAKSTEMKTKEIECKAINNVISQYKDSIKEKTEKLNSITTSIAVLNTKINTYKEQKTKIESSITQLLNNLATEKEKILYNKNELSVIIKREDTLKKISTLITREFRGYLLKDIIAYIDKKAKEYSIEVFNTEKIQIKLDGNNILISYDNKEYENLSGGEKCKCDIIIQLAIRKMLVTYLNFSSNIFVLDEGLDYLDSIGCEKILNLIYNKLDGVENIFIITHHSNDLPITFDNIITVVKDRNGISHIQ